MSLDPKSIYNIQRTSDGSSWEEVYISGSNLLIQTDGNGGLVGLKSIPNGTHVPYAVSAGYASVSTTSATASYFTGTSLVPDGTISSSAQVVNSIFGQQISPSGITSSLTGTSSYAQTASYANYAANVPAGLVSSSAQIVSGLIGSSVVSSSAQFNNSSIFDVGQITASAIQVTRLTVAYITSSVLYDSGSSEFGTKQSDRHKFTGSVGITGSLTVSGPIYGTSSWANNVDYINVRNISQSSFFAGTASYALSYSGTSGTSGTSGVAGTSGAAGTSGTSGVAGTSGISGTSGTSGGVGASGTSGVSGTSGTSGTSGGVGASGTSGTSGTSGGAGVSGTSGVDGTSGISGTSGTSGIAGDSGTSGTSGVSGTSGTSGGAGVSGTSGTSGTSGGAGVSGTSGTSGTSGGAGVSGTSGVDGTSGTSGTSPTIIATENYVLKASSVPNTLTTSSIYDDGIKVSIASNVVITGSLTIDQYITGSIITSSYSKTSSYVLLAVSSSFSTTSSYAERSNTSSYSETSSFSVSSVSSSVNFLQQTIVTNQTVGGLSSGTTLQSGSNMESILRQILITYIPPTLTSLSMRTGSSPISTSDRDVGNPLYVNTASFTVAVDSPSGVGPISSSWTGSGADVGTLTYYFQNSGLPNGSNVRSVGGNYTINRASSAGTVTFTVNGRRSDTGAAISGATSTVSFRFRNYMCASSTVVTSNATAQTVLDTGLVTSQLDTDRSWTATCTVANDTVGNYTYIMYPASYGDLTGIIQNGALPVLTAFSKLGDYVITTTYGASLTLRVYQSNSTKAFSSGTTLAIS